MADQTVIWTGVSTAKYTLYLYPIGNAYKSVQGVYIFCKQGTDGRWYPVYIGEATNLNDRLNKSDETSSMGLHYAEWRYAYLRDGNRGLYSPTEAQCGD